MSYYFYGEGIGNFTFYRMPKALLMDPEYKGMSTEAKLLYSLMLDRTTLSMMNNWKDQKGRIFIYFSRPYCTWQAGQTLTSLHISAPSPAMLSELGEQCSDPDRNHFRQFWPVGIIPNPYDRTSASCAFL